MIHDRNDDDDDDDDYSDWFIEHPPTGYAPG
jgi:hypothetical protein